MTTATRRSGLIIPRTARAPLTGRGIMLPREYRNLLTNGDLADLLSGTVNGFLDTFADLTAWTAVTGAPTVLANVVTLPGPSLMVGGHSEGWDYQTGSQHRFVYQTNAAFEVRPRYVNANNWIAFRHSLNGASIIIEKDVAGSVTQPANVSSGGLVAGTTYWFVWSVIGNVYTLEVWTDVANAPGAKVAASGTATATLTGADIATFDHAQFALGNQGSVACTTGQIGGVGSNYCRMVIAAPPGFTLSVFAGVPSFCVSKTTRFFSPYSLSIFVSGTCNGAWKQNFTSLTTNTMSARVKTSGIVGTGARISCDGLNSTSPNLLGTAEWAPLTHTVAVAAPSTAYANLVGTAGTVWFDMLWLAAQRFDTGQRRYNTIRSGWR